MKILVTGGAGFIGSHVADCYLADGHEVLVLDNLATGSRRNLPSQARFVQFDIRDGKGVEHLFASQRFDAVNHHAAQIDVRKSTEEPLYDAEVNILRSLKSKSGCPAQWNGSAASSKPPMAVDEAGSVRRVPVYNEEANIELLLERIAAILPPIARTA